MATHAEVLSGTSRRFKTAPSVQSAPTSSGKRGDCGQKHRSLECIRQSYFEGKSIRVVAHRPPRIPGSRPTVVATRAFSFGSPGFFAAREQKDNVAGGLSDGNGNDANIVTSSSELLDAVNAVVADIVDGQKFLKETGRTKPRPMKRRALVVCLALGAIQPCASDLEDRFATGLRRTTSTSFVRTCRLASQLSFGASRIGALARTTSCEPTAA